MNIQDVGHQIPVFAVSDISFFMIRDFGTALMQRERYEQTAAGACTEMIDKYPQHKRSFKTLYIAIDNFMKQRQIWHNPGNTKSSAHEAPFQAVSSSQPITILLYSKVDERFDMITVGHGRNGEHTKRK